MSPDEWKRVQDLFHEALDRAASERDAFLDEACAGDDELRAQVQALLDADAGEARRLDDAAASRGGVRRDRARRDGARLPCRTNGRRRVRGAEAGALLVGRAGGGRPLPRRTPHPRAARPSPHRAPLRRGRHAERHPFLRDGVRGGGDDHGILRSSSPTGRRAARPLCHHRPSGRLRASKPRRASRPEAVERVRLGVG